MLNTALIQPNQPQQRSRSNWSVTTPIPRGERGTLQSLRLMAHFCRRDAQSEELRQIAQCIIGDVAGHDFQGEIRALFYFVRDQIKYRKDPIEVERVQDALRTIQIGSGDCDDKIVLLVSLLAVCGHRGRFAVSGPRAGKWTHVYCEVATRNGWLPLDPTPEGAAAGWEQDAPVKGVFELWPATSANIRVVRNRVVPSTSSQPKRQREVSAAVSPSQQAIFLMWLREGACVDCAAEMAGIEVDDWGLGADKYEWKYNAALGKCELKKKSCGFFCKIGGVFKKIGQVALAIAPIALAPFTAGGSLALTGAAGTAVSIGATAASAANQIISSRYTAGLPSNAEIQEPTGQCLDLLRKEAEEEARRIAEAAAAKQTAEQVKSATASGSGLSNPVLLAALIIGGALVFSRN